MPSNHPQYYDFSEHIRPGKTRRWFSRFRPRRLQAIWRRLNPVYRLNEGITWGVFLTIYGALCSVLGSTGVAAIGGYGVLQGICWGLAYGVIMAATYAVSTGVSALTAQSQPTQSNASGVMLNFQAPTQPRRIVHGRRKIGGVIVFADTTGGSNKMLHIIVEWGWGKLQILTDGAGEKVWCDELRMQTLQTRHGASLISHEFHNGSCNQTVSTALQSYFPAWNEAMRYRSYSYFCLKANVNAWPRLPKFTAEVEKIDIYDARDGTMKVARNEALARRDLITHPLYGGGIDGSLINKDSVIDSAQWLEDNGYSFDACLWQQKPLTDYHNQYLINSRGETVWTGEEYKILVRTWASSVMPLDEFDVKQDPGKINAIGIATGGIADTQKRIKVFFGDTVDNYNEKYAYWPQAAPGLSQPDIPETVLELIGTTGFEQALKIAKYQYMRSQYSNLFDLTAHPGGPINTPVGVPRVTALDLCDFIDMSHNTEVPVQSIPEDWSEKILSVKSKYMNQNNEIVLVLQDEAEAIYDDTVNVAEHLCYTTNLPTGQDDAGMPTDISYETYEDESTVRAVDAKVIFKCSRVWGAEKYEFRYRKPDETAWHKKSFTDPGGEVDLVTKVGTGTLTMKSGGNYYGDTDLTIKIQIDGTGSPNTFKVSYDNGVTWGDEEIEITGDWQDLDYGLKIWFNGLTGGHIGDYYTFLVKEPSEIRVTKGPLPCNQIYYYQACSIINGKRSEWATPETPITTWSPETPSVTGIFLVATSYSDMIVIAWTDPTDREYEIDRWLIFRAINSSNFDDAVQINDEAKGTHTYKDKAVSGGNEYNYWIKIKNKSAQISSEIGPASGKLTQPDVPDSPDDLPDVIPPTPNPPILMGNQAPVNYNPTGTRRQALVYWQPCTDDRGGAVRYVVKFWKGGETTKVTTIGDIDRTDISLIDLDIDTTYYWTVEAVDEAGNHTSACAAQSFATGHDAVPPTAPASLTVIPHENYFKLIWPVNTADLDMQGGKYRIYVWTTNTPASALGIMDQAHPTTQMELGINGTTFDQTLTIQSGTPYHFWITAFDKDGNESAKTYCGAAYINTAPDVPDNPDDLPDVIPPTPNPPTGMGNDAVADYNFTATRRQTRVYWNACTDDRGGPVRYDVKYWKSGETTLVTTIGDIDRTDVSLINLDLDTTYYWTVEAVDEAGNHTSACAAQSFATGHNADTPNAPVSPTLMLAEASMIVRWTLNTEKDMKGGGKYRIYINTSNNSGSSKLIRELAHPHAATMISIASESYSGSGDITVGYDTEYWLWVAAVDKDGNESSKAATSPVSGTLEYVDWIKHFSTPWKMKNQVQTVYERTTAGITERIIPAGKIGLLQGFYLHTDSTADCSIAVGDSGGYITIIGQTVVSGILTNEKDPSYCNGLYLSEGGRLKVTINAGAVNPIARMTILEFDADAKISAWIKALNTGVTYTVPTGYRLLLPWILTAGDNVYLQTNQGGTWYNLWNIDYCKVDLTRGVLQIPPGKEIRGSDADYSLITVGIIIKGG